MGSLNIRACLLIVLVLLFGSCDRARAIKEERLQCLKQMQFLWELLDDFVHLYGGYPSTSLVDEESRVLHSWRFNLASGVIGYLGEHPVGPWPDDPAYETWETGECSSQSRLFSARDPSNRDSRNKAKRTDFLALTGQGTAFSEIKKELELDRKEVCGLLEDAADAILLVECVNDFHWIESGDVTREQIHNSKSETGLGDLKGNYPDCFAVLFVDGAAWFIKDTVPKSEIGKFLTVESAKKYDREVVLKEYVIQKLAPLSRASQETD